MKQEKIQNLLVTNLLNIEYLTGIKASVATMLVMQKEAYVFLDQRYSEMASKRAEGIFQVLDPVTLKHSLLQVGQLGIEADTMTVEMYDSLKSLLKNKKIVHTSGFIIGLRRIKEHSELSKIRQACKITKSVLRVIPTELKVGMTEQELAWRIESLCREKGATGMAFDTIVAFGKNTSSPHHKPTKTKYAKNDLVQIDMGASVDSYCSDYSRIFGTSTMNAEQKKAHSALKQAKKSAELLLKPGTSLHRLDKLARKILRNHGYGDDVFCHALGHGLGLEIHEGVVLSQKRPDHRLLKGDVITIEPGLYFPGKFGIRIEDTHIIS